jgi:hypothetical protein
MIVKFVSLVCPKDQSLEHVFECDSVEKYCEYGGTSFTMHSKIHGEMTMGIPDDEMYDVYYMSDSGRTVDVIHVNQVKINPKGLLGV